jgi:hypothetical protein
MATARPYPGATISAREWQSSAVTIRALLLGDVKFSERQRLVSDLPDPLAEAEITARVAEFRDKAVHLVAARTMFGPSLTVSTYAAVVAYNDELLGYVDLRNKTPQRFGEPESVANGSVVLDWEPTGTVFIIGS